MSALAPIERPNGKLYRPRKLTAQILGAEDDHGIIVFGTHDLAVAREAAEKKLAAYNESVYRPPVVALHLVGEGEPRWWTQKLSHFDDYTPYYAFHTDRERGRAGIEYSLEYRDQRYPDEQPPAPGDVLDVTVHEPDVLTAALADQEGQQLVQDILDRNKDRH